MTDKSRRTLNAFLKMTAQEQTDFFAELKKVREAPATEQRVLLEDLAKGTRVSLGPLSGGCPYCGRS
jgi:hypothetical protein